MSYQDPFLFTNIFVPDNDAKYEESSGGRDTRPEARRSLPSNVHNGGNGGGSSNGHHGGCNGDDNDDEKQSDRSSSEEDDEDEDRAVGVFYDQHVEMATWEREKQHQTRDAPTKTSTTKPIKEHTAVPTTDTPLQGVGTISSDKSSNAPRAKVRQYAGYVNAAVATMDHAVSIPAALRGAARRTMFDVLVEVEQRNKFRAKAEAGRGEGQRGAALHANSVAGSSTGIAGNRTVSAAAAHEALYAEKQPHSKVLSATSSARDATYRALFPTTTTMTSLAASVKERAAEAPALRAHPQSSTASPQARAPGKTRSDPVAIHSGSSSHNLLSGSCGSHTTLATAAGDSQKVSVNGLSSATDPARPLASPTPTTALSTAKDGEVQCKPQYSSNITAATAAAAGAGAGAPVVPTTLRSGPDRRLRHLLPAHLHASRFGESKDGRPSNRLGSFDLQKASWGRRSNGDDDDVVVSDVSSASSEVHATCSSGHRGAEQSTPHSSVRHVSDKDACLLDILEGGPVKDRKQKPLPSTRDAVSSEAALKLDAGWLQRLDEEEARMFQFQQQRSDTQPGRQASDVKDRLLEDVVMGHPPQRFSSPEESRRRHHHHRGKRQSKGQRGSEGSNSSSGKRTASASTSSCRSSRSNSRSSKEPCSRCSSTHSQSSASVDLMRDVDDEVPQWVRQQAACQQQLLLQGKQPQRGNKSLMTDTVVANYPSSPSLVRQRAEMMKPLIGKPPLFHPSCAASRKPPTHSSVADAAVFSASRTSRFQRFNAAVRTTASYANGFFSSATTAASSFLASWKEGKRMLRQNPTATSVVQYLCNCFEQWKPYGPELQEQAHLRTLPPALESAEISMFGADEGCSAPSPVSSSQQQKQQCAASNAVESINKDKSGDNGGMDSSGAVALTSKPTECGVEVKIRVQYVEAAFGVAVARGVVAWCSDDARQRLHLDSNPVTVPPNDTKSVQAENAEISGAPLLPPPHDTGPPWSFLFPEPALMQMQMAVGEHLYLAHPYYVYAEKRVVLASYNFTTDAVVRQQEAQFALELEERLRAVEQLDNGKGNAGSNRAGPPHTGDVAHCNLHTPRHRGISPVRASAPLLTSPFGRSPTELGRRSGAEVVTDRLPNRVLYEIPGSASTPQRAARTLVLPTPAPSIATGPSLPETSADARTPVHPRSTALEEGVSPEPHPPSSRQQQHQQLIGRPVHAGALRRKGYAGDDANCVTSPASLLPTPDFVAAPKSSSSSEKHYPQLLRGASLNAAASASLSPPYIPASTASVSSLAADGFYDPLAMPAFHIIRLTGPGTAASVRDDVGPTVVLTGSSSVEAEKGRIGSHHYQPEGLAAKQWETSSQVGRHPKSRKGHWSVMTRAAAGAEEKGMLPPPPPLASLFANPTTATADEQIPAEPVRTFGTAEAAVDDPAGHGFFRGPPPSWDIPVEVLWSLSRVTSQRASKALTDQRSSGEARLSTATAINTAPAGDGDGTPSQRVRKAEVSQGGAPQRPSTTKMEACRKRAREDGMGLTEEKRAAAAIDVSPDMDFLPSQAVASQREQLRGRSGNQVLGDVSHSFPTPLPSLTQLPSQTIRLAEGNDSLSCSISSPSDLSDADSGSEVPLTTGGSRINTTSDRPPARRFVGRGCGVRLQNSIRQQQQQQRQEEWIQQLWQQPIEAIDAWAIPQVGETRGASTRYLAATTTASTTATAHVRGSALVSSGLVSREEAAGEHVNVVEEGKFPSRIAAAPPNTRFAPPSSGCEQALLSHEVDADASTATTGFYALNDVVLSDSDE
jgi:hypothetical protein